MVECIGKLGIDRKVETSVRDSRSTACPRERYEPSLIRLNNILWSANRGNKESGTDPQQSGGTGQGKSEIMLYGEERSTGEELSEECSPDEWIAKAESLPSD